MQVWLTFCGKKQSPYMYALHTYFFKNTFKTAMTLYLKGLCQDLLSISPSYNSYRCLNIKIKMLAPHCTHFGKKKKQTNKSGNLRRSLVSSTLKNQKLKHNKTVYLVVRSFNEVWQNLWNVIINGTKFIRNLCQRVTETTALINNPFTDKLYFPPLVIFPFVPPEEKKETKKKDCEKKKFKEIIFLAVLNLFPTRSRH